MTTLKQYLLRKKSEALDVIAARETRKRKAKAQPVAHLKPPQNEVAYERGAKMGGAFYAC
jgi:hypothetical protein